VRELNPESKIATQMFLTDATMKVKLEEQMEVVLILTTVPMLAMVVPGLDQPLMEFVLVTQPPFS
jgi:hypothetical protein